MAEYFAGVNFLPLSLALSFSIVLSQTLYGHRKEELRKEGSEREISGKESSRVPSRQLQRFF